MFGIYQLVVSDLDGTLLNSKGEITNRTLESIKKAQSYGVRFVILTGRQYKEVRTLLLKHQLVCDVIGLNGAEIIAGDGSSICEEFIDSKDIKEIISICEEEQVIYKAYNNEIIIANQSEETLGKMLDFAKIHYKDVPNILICAFNYYNMIYNNCLAEKDVLDYLIKKQVNVSKVEILSPFRIKLGKIQERITNNKNLNVFSSNLINIEVTNKNIDKGQAVKKLADTLSIDRDKIIGIGDNFNDVPMFKNVGVSVVMGNAPVELKEKVTFVAKTNDEDGVAEVIDKFVLNGISYS